MTSVDYDDACLDALQKQLRALRHKITTLQNRYDALWFSRHDRLLRNAKSKLSKAELAAIRGNLR